MSRVKEDPEREERLAMEIVVDAYEGEIATAWHAYIENTLRFPFKARCTHPRQASPLKFRQRVTVIGMADFDECEAEMFVLVQWDDDELAVPLEQLKPIGADEETVQATEDWGYWVGRGNRFY